MLKKYPAKLSLTSFTLFFGLIQFLFIAAFTERDPTHWKIVSGEEIFTILYAVRLHTTSFIVYMFITSHQGLSSITMHILQGIISSGLVIVLQTWCIQKGGPVFVASFQPVQTVLVAGMASIILGDQLYSGGYVVNFMSKHLKNRRKKRNSSEHLFRNIEQPGKIFSVLTHPTLAGSSEQHS